MTDVRDLYQRTILEHGRRPRNFRVLQAVDGHIVTAELRNVTCGDRILVAVDLGAPREHAVIRDIAFQGAGCAISMASASVMTEIVKGRSPAEARRLGDILTVLVTDGSESVGESDLGDLVAFRGVARFPVRIACATLAWLALGSLLSSS